MKTVTYLSLVAVSLLLVVGISCASGSPTSPALPPSKTAAPAATVAPDWEKKWEAAVAAAKKEGVVNIYASWKPTTRDELIKAFKDKYGIALEFSTFEGPAAIIPKVVFEMGAGLNVVDVMGAGTILLGKRQGILGSMKPLLILPEVLNPNAWAGGELPFSDREGTEIAMSGTVVRYLVYNTDLVKEGELKSYKDLLKPQYKDKIVMHDFSIPGTTAVWVTHLGSNIWGETETIDFLKRLLKEQRAVVTRDYRANIEALSRGKYAILAGPDTALLAEFVGRGLPIKPAIFEEDSVLSAAAGCMAVSPKPSHPNATTVFVNWLLTREGQSIFARSSANPSRRLDASTEGVFDLYVPRAGKKYFNSNSEEFLEVRIKWLEISRKIVAESQK